MTNKNDSKPNENPNYPTFRESMRDITGIVGLNPMISTSSKELKNEKGKRVFRKFKDEKGILSEMDQTKSDKDILTSLKD